MGVGNGGGALRFPSISILYFNTEGGAWPFNNVAAEV